MDLKLLMYFFSALPKRRFYVLLQALLVVYEAESLAAFLLLKFVENFYS